MSEYPDDYRDPRGPLSREEQQRAEDRRRASRRRSRLALYSLLAGGPPPTRDDLRVRGRSKGYWAFVVLFLLACVVLALLRPE